MKPQEIAGQRIRQLRDEKGISQESLAHIAEIDRTYVSSIEKGERNISIEVLVKIARALDTTASELIKNLEDEL